MSEQKKCSVEGCVRIPVGRGLCRLHYTRLWRGKPLGSVTPTITVRKKPRLFCSIEGCYDEHMAKGLCRIHYLREYRHGDTDSMHANYGSKQRITEAGYRAIYQPAEDKYKLEHRILAEKALGRPLPEGAVVHHLNGDKLDNFTKYNLVICPDQAYHVLLHKRARDLGYE